MAIFRLPKKHKAVRTPPFNATTFLGEYVFLPDHWIVTLRIDDVIENPHFIDD